MATPWEVSTATYAEKSKLVSAQDNSPSDVSFKPDGTKMYMVGTQNDTVYQYTLTTPWDVNTATYDNKSKDVSAQDIAPQGVTFKPDGTKMYIVGSSSNTVSQYSLSAAWDVSTAVYEDKYKNVSDQDALPYGVTFKPDGAKMYMTGSSSDTVYQYTLSTPWDVDTAIYAEKSKLVSGQDSYPHGIFFKPDGTKMYMVGTYNDRVYQYTLSTAWDVSTATYADKYKYVGAEDTYPYDVSFKPDGDKMYIVGWMNSTIYQYGLPAISLTSTTNIVSSITSALTRGKAQALTSTSAIVSSITSLMSRGVTETLTTTSAITSSITGRLTKIIDLVSMSAITASITSSLSRGVTGILISTISVVTTVTSALSRGRKEALISTVAGIVSFTGNLSRGVKELLTSTIIKTSSTTAILSRGIIGTLESITNIATSSTGSLSRGITQALLSTTNIVSSFTSRITKIIQIASISEIAISTVGSLSRGVTEALASTASVVVSIVTELSSSGLVSLRSAVAVTTSIPAILSRGIAETLTSISVIVTSLIGRITRIESLASISAITTSIISALSRGIKGVLNSTVTITTSVVSVLDRGFEEALTSTANIIISTTASLGRGITEALASTVNGVVSLTGSLSRGIKESLVSTASIVSSFIIRITRIIQISSTSTIVISIISSLSRKVKALLSTVNINTFAVSVLRRGVAEALTSTINIVSSIISDLTAIYQWIKVTKEEVIKMALLVPDVGEVLLLSYALNKVAATDVKLKIFTNDYIPVEGSVVADFTEATAAGYAAKELAGASWTIATDGGVTTATYAQQTFNFTAASTNYGYYITNNNGSQVLWAERFSDAPHTLPSGGGTEKITVNLIGE